MNHPATLLRPIVLLGLITVQLLASPTLLAQKSAPSLSGAAQARRVTIIRDEWGVPHIYGRSDADAVFGLMYAQCEDNYWQLEETMIGQQGRRAELYGEKELERDAQAALFRSVERARETYRNGNTQLKALCHAAAAGVNHYLDRHPAVERRLLQRYEPWMFLIAPLSDGRDHGVRAGERSALLSAATRPIDEGADRAESGESGSNAIAIGPRKSLSGHSMLLINPHVGLFGPGQRYEAHLVSEEGLNASGFAMFGQFWIWSGFTATTAWAHTNTASDYEDVYLESFDHPTDSARYRWGSGYRKATVWQDTIRYRKADGSMGARTYRFLRTHHGPAIARRDRQWLTVRHAVGSMGDYVLQAWKMSKAKDLAAFRRAMEKVQLTTNTMYADAAGNIVYWHGNAIPRRNPEFDWMYPVDGTDPRTEWKGLHALSEIVQVRNPAGGWLQNGNSTPFLSAGAHSPSPARFAPYLAYDPQTFRGMELVRLLDHARKLSLDDLQSIAYSRHLPMMEAWVPQLLAAYGREAERHPSLVTELGAAMDTLRRWNYHTSVDSRATTLASFWATQYFRYESARHPDTPYFAPSMTPHLHSTVMPLDDSTAVGLFRLAVQDLNGRYGTPFVPFGTINRLQRVHTSGTLEPFDDAKPSLPVPFAASGMGMLPAFRTSASPGNKKFYGVAGNTYTALVELGPKVRARSVVYFGQSADPASPHYFDQAPLYVEGKMKEAWYYKSDVLQHATRTYHPGDEK